MLPEITYISKNGEISYFILINGPTIQRELIYCITAYC